MGMREMVLVRGCDGIRGWDLEVICGYQKLLTFRKKLPSYGMKEVRLDGSSFKKRVDRLRKGRGGGVLVGVWME